MSLEKKIPFFTRIRKSAVSLYTSLFLSAVTPVFGCSDPDEQNGNDNKEKVAVQLLKTDANGEAKYTSPEGEDVTLKITDSNKKPLSDVKIMNLEGLCLSQEDKNCFKAFNLNHSQHHPQLEIAGHHSSHEYSLTSTLASSFGRTNYDSSAKERNFQSADRLVDWSIANWDYQGCWQSEQLKTRIKSGTWLVREYLKIFSFGLLDKAVAEFSKKMAETLDPEMGAHVWLFNPGKHGLPLGTGLLWTIDVRKQVAEILDNKIDDDCDGQIDETTADDPCKALAEETILFCDDFKGTSLDTGKWDSNPCGGSATYKLNNGVLEFSVGNGNCIMDSKSKYTIGTDTLIFETKWKLNSTTTDMFSRMADTNSGIGFINYDQKLTCGNATKSCGENVQPIANTDITLYHIYKFEGKGSFDFYVDNIKVGTSNKCVPTNVLLPIDLTCQKSGSCYIEYIKLSKK